MKRSDFIFQMVIVFLFGAIAGGLLVDLNPRPIEIQWHWKGKQYHDTLKVQKCIALQAEGTEGYSVTKCEGR